MLNLTVEAGNFAPFTQNRADSIKVQALLAFYRMEDYDAVTLSSRETRQGFDVWQRAEKDGTPIVVANLFAPGGHRHDYAQDRRSVQTTNPVFEPYVIRKEDGERLGVIGLLSESAWKARRDTATSISFTPPLEMGNLIRRVAGKTDQLTVIGEFTQPEADTLVAHFPEIDLVVSSGIKTAERPQTLGHSVVIGSGSRGYTANYVEFTPNPSDSLIYRTASQSLDTSIPEDSTVLDFVSGVNTLIKTPTNGQ